MMSQQVLKLDRLTKYYGAKLILNEVSLTLNRRDRMALVGENGVGKTTLAKMMVGKEKPDIGQVIVSAKVDVGYLPQAVTFGLEGGTTVQDYLKKSVGRLDLITSQMKSLEKRMSAPTLEPEELEHILAQYGQLQEEFERKGGHDLDYRFKRVLSGLDIDYIDQNRSLSSLSGGEKTRVALAALLLRSPDLLILDEPTNHLDFEALDWLEMYLAQYQNCLFAISHDRQFLNKVVHQIVELSHTDHKITIYPGNYDFYLGEREKFYEKQMAAFWAQREEIKQLRSFIKTKTYSTGKGRGPTDRNKMAYKYHGQRTEKSIGREIQAAKYRLEELLANPLKPVRRRWEINPEFDPVALGSQDIIELIDISKQYDDRDLLAGVSEIIRNGDRIVLVAPNGTGKTTLLKIIMGMVRPDGGEVRIAKKAKLGYLDQDQETLDLNVTVLEEYRKVARGEEAEVRAQLNRYGLFSGDQVFQKVGSLSLGQRRKLQLAKLVSSRANVFILDEPTNYLDLTSLEEFERALQEFKGTILAVSHDRWFIKQIATKIWHLEAGRIQATGINRQAGAS